MTLTERHEILTKLAEVIDGVLDEIAEKIHIQWGDNIAFLMATAALAVLDSAIDIQDHLKKEKPIK